MPMLRSLAAAIVVACLVAGIARSVAPAAFAGEPQVEGGPATEATAAPRVASRSDAFGRTWVEYEQQSDPAWGYPAPQTDRFWLASPERPTAAAPLCVVLHSAGGTGRETFQPNGRPHHDRGAFGDEAFYVLCLDCAANRKQDWWWGCDEIERQPERYRAELTPTERRVLATVEWAARTFPIDRDRIYLTGISMGGSGSLGIGLNHGDVFAAVSVVVPAGIRHMKARLRPPLENDPPPLVNISSHLDGHARGQEELLELFAAHHYAVAFAWEPLGHDAARIADWHPAVYDMPWLTIRRNEAYPAFTSASTDDRYPGLNDRTSADQQGQINGCFRWRNVEDCGPRLTMELRLVRPDELRHRRALPAEATVDVTFRRVQRFAVVPGQSYEWRLAAGDRELQAGRVTATADGRITVPRVRLTDAAAILTVSR
jgi:predicted esterase